MGSSSYNSLNSNRVLCTPSFNSELQLAITGKNIWTTRSRAKLLTALNDQASKFKEEKRKSMRHKTILEIFSSEITYMQQLEVLIKFFMIPLQDRCLSNPAMSALFSHLESVYRLSLALLEELKENETDVGYVFIKLSPFLKLYSMYAYCYRQHFSSVTETISKNKELNSFIKAQESRPEVSMTLSSILIAPIQRVPRYKLLLKELLGYTEEDSTHHKVLKEAIDKIEAAILHIDEEIKNYEQAEKLVLLSKRLTGTKPHLIAPGRRIIKAGQLMKISQNGKSFKQCHTVLMSDTILICKGYDTGPLKFSCIIPLRNCQVESLLNSVLFKVESPGDSVLLCASDTTSGSDWINAIGITIKQLEEHENTLHKELSKRRLIRRSDLKRTPLLLTYFQKVCSHGILRLLK